MKKHTQKRTRITKKELPGYPKYPASEDILNRAEKVDLDVDGSLKDSKPGGIAYEGENITPDEKESTGISESDLTKSELEALKDAENSSGEDEVLKDRVYPVDFSGDDLDVPGSELDDDNEQIGSEDEENNSYSLGGDNNDR
jgi:hypothetical protein